MNRLLRRQRVALALLITFSVSFIGVAVADVQHADQPKVGLELSPNDGANLPDSADVTVSGTGFTPNTPVVLTEQAPVSGGNTAASDTLCTATHLP